MLCRFVFLRRPGWRMGVAGRGGDHDRRDRCGEVLRRLASVRWTIGSGSGDFRPVSRSRDELGDLGGGGVLPWFVAFAVCSAPVRRWSAAADLAREVFGVRVSRWSGATRGRDWRARRAPLAAPVDPTGGYRWARGRGPFWLARSGAPPLPSGHAPRSTASGGPTALDRNAARRGCWCVWCVTQLITQLRWVRDWE